ncbi:MAG: S8 family peptidase [Candidatus Cloacimonetes bacterium]|nr:S8 family peptidase [Candidatus Cloacimonadota bacterium]
MKKIILIPALIILFISQIGAAKISGRLMTEIKLKERFNRGEFDDVPQLVKDAPDFDSQLILLHFKIKPDAGLISKLEDRDVTLFPKSWIPPCSNHPTGFLTARIPVNREKLLQLEKIQEIEMINSAERTLKLHNDRAAEHTGALTLSENPYNLTGEAVKIAVIDSGFQLDHPDIPDPFIAVDYSNYTAEPDSDFTVSNETTHTGHGTHVAGTILGQGTLSNGIWKGMAPGADFIALKVGHDNTGAIYLSALLHCFYAARFYYGADFVNASLGGYDDYHDGSSEDAQIVDLISEDGCAAFISTGNDADKNQHYSGSLAGNDLSDFIAVNYNDTTQTRDVIYNFNMLWYDGPDPELQEEMTMVFYNEDFNPLFFQDVEEMTQSPRGTQSRYGTATVLGQNPFYVRVMNQSSETLDFHLFITSGNGEFADPDPHYTIASPADADLAISVGSYNSRINWTSWEGLQITFTGSDLEELSPFSNQGPRIDGMIAPTIVAPGVALISPRDDDAWNGPPFGIWTPFVISNSYAEGDSSGGLPADYIILTGTSMSSPAACGSAALLKEYNPTLTRDELVTLITVNARTDEFTGEVPNGSWGYGKLDVENAIQQIVAVDENSISNNSGFELYQNYPNPFSSNTTISYSSPENNQHAKINIYNIKGQQIKKYSLFNNKYSILWDGRDDDNKPVSSGIYFYKMSVGGFTSTKKMILMK